MLNIYFVVKNMKNNSSKYFKTIGIPLCNLVELLNLQGISCMENKELTQKEREAMNGCVSSLTLLDTGTDRQPGGSSSRKRVRKQNQNSGSIFTSPSPDGAPACRTKVGDEPGVVLAFQMICL